MMGMANHGAPGTAVPTKGALIAGVDIGNSTTEVAIGRLLGPGLGASPVLADRAPTAGLKGSLKSLEAAAELVHRLESECGERVDTVIVSELVPAPVFDASWPSRSPDADLPVTLLDVPDAATCTGVGAFAGRFVPLDMVKSAGQGDAIVIGVDSTWDFADAARELRAVQASGLPMVGVLIERDEAVLIGNRTSLTCPCIDNVPLSGIKPDTLVVAESTPQGNGVTRLADPVFLARSLNLEPAQVPALLPLTRHVATLSAAVIVRSTTDPHTGTQDTLGEIAWTEGGETHQLALPAAADVLARAVPPGQVTSLTAAVNSQLAKALQACPGGVRDLAALDLPVAESVPLALLASAAPIDDVPAALADLVGRPVVLGSSEARAAWVGAHATPGLPAEVVVVDIGAGTLDVMTDHDSVAVAGAGDLITAGVALSLDIPTAVAEMAKMNPAVRVETPHLVAREDGVREFPKAPLPGSSVGQLSLLDDRGDLTPIGSRLAPETWHRDRLNIKATVLERGLLRARRVLAGGFPSQALLLLAGGGAEDPELVTAASRFAHLGQVAIADVAGRFGPRCAVAWGLVLTADCQSSSVHSLPDRSHA